MKIQKCLLPTSKTRLKPIVSTSFLIKINLPIKFCPMTSSSINRLNIQSLNPLSTTQRIPIETSCLRDCSHLLRKKSWLVDRKKASKVILWSYVISSKTKFNLLRKLFKVLIKLWVTISGLCRLLFKKKASTKQSSKECSHVSNTQHPTPNLFSAINQAIKQFNKFLNSKIQSLRHPSTSEWTPTTTLSI